MKNTITLHLLAFCFTLVLSVDEKRTDRMFSLFNVVKFTNSPCQAKSSTALQGVCYTDKECSDRGGTEDGNCAAGFGRCCVFRNSVCASTISENCTFIENPGFPNGFTGTIPGDCAFTVNRMQTDICQIRLDFTSMTLGKPTPTTAAGSCAGDKLVIAPGATNSLGPSMPPTLCGTNTGQHVYVDAGTATAAATLTFTMAAASTASWRVKVSQIECSNMYKAPNGCLQYFMGMKNTVTSFNYGDGTGDCNPQCNLLPLDYNVCFRAEAGMCSMQYVETSRTSGDAFELNIASDNAAANSATGRVTAANCASSGIQIPVSTADFANSQGTYCGNFLGSIDQSTARNVVSGASGSFMFRAYANAAASEALSGFSIDASQQPCS